MQEGGDRRKKGDSQCLLVSGLYSGNSHNANTLRARFM